MSQQPLLITVLHSVIQSESYLIASILAYTCLICTTISLFRFVRLLDKRGYPKKAWKEYRKQRDIVDIIAWVSMGTFLLIGLSGHLPMIANAVQPALDRGEQVAKTINAILESIEAKVKKITKIY